MGERGNCDIFFIIDNFLKDWAQSFDYNAVVDHMVAWEKQKFCYSKSAPMIEHHKKKERTMNAYEAYKDQIREQVQDGLIEAYAGCFDPMVEIMVDEVIIDVSILVYDLSN